MNTPILLIRTRMTFNTHLLTAPTKNWRFSAPQTHLWLNKHLFTAGSFVLKNVHFLLLQNDSSNFMTQQLDIY
jgi:hypothetical protein